MYTIHRQVVVPSTRQEVWDFISNPENLNRITPDALHFSILTPLPTAMFNGLLIEYRITLPILGRQRWVTEIKHIRPLTAFVDEQRIGPYKFWYHYHEIQQCDKGIIIRDQVSYCLPFSLVGKLVHRFFIKKMLTRIFDYRQKRFMELFSPPS